jgi:hypothetical protein
MAMYMVFVVTFISSTYLRKEGHLMYDYVQVMTNRFADTDPAFADILSEGIHNIIIPMKH